MSHRVQSVENLYNDSKALYENVILGEADGIINDLGRTINTLKNSWEGKDAGTQINNIIKVYNAMVKIRNAGALLSRESSKTASGYREIQNLNRANLETLTPLAITEDKAESAPYEDNRDTINITNEAINGKAVLDEVNNKYEEFKNSISRYYDKIMENWQEGDGHDRAQQEFDSFIRESGNYKKTLEDVSRSIADSLKNYNMNR